MPKPLDEKLQVIGEEIRHGRALAAREHLQKICARGVDRAYAAQIAALARRAGVPDLGLRALHKVVRPTGRLSRPATSEEKMEYASCLTKIGAAEESLEILESLDAAALPDIYLFKTFNLVSQWEYAATIPLLHAYLELPQVTDYWRMVAKVNLASAYVYERRHEEAQGCLAEILKETRGADFALLHGNALHLSLANAVLRKDFVAAADYLKKCRAILSNTDTEKFFLRKWEAIADLLQHGLTAGTKARMDAVRAEALERRHWETLRDCDRFTLTVTRAEATYFRLYFGTPFPGFRRWLARNFGNIALPPSYVWIPREGKTSFTLRVSEFEPGTNLHRLLHALSADFYRPFRLASLCRRVYPGEFYNPESAPGKMHQLLNRFRSLCERKGLGLEVEEDDGFYRVIPARGWGLEVQIDGTPADRGQTELARLAAVFAGAAFGAQEAVSQLGIPYRTMARLLAKGVEEGQLEKIGKGSATRYRFKARQAA